jgi:hypothetical protein
LPLPFFLTSCPSFLSSSFFPPSFSFQHNLSKFHIPIHLSPVRYLPFPFSESPSAPILKTIVVGFLLSPFYFLVSKTFT